MTVLNARIKTIPSGVPGVDATVKEMVKMVKAGKRNPHLRAFAMQKVRHLPPKSWLAEINALFQYVQKRIRYLRDINDIETLQTPEKTIELGQGDCDDKAILLATLLETIGHPARFLVVGFTQPGEFSHVLVQTKVGNKWLSLETTEMWPMGKVPKNVVCHKIYSI